MTHTPLTKSEREKIVARRNQLLGDGAAVEWYDFGDLPYQGERNLAMKGVDWKLAALSVNALPRLLADLDAAEAERDALRQIAEGCCNATDGGCSPGVSIEFLRHLPSEVEHIKRGRDRLRKMPQSAFEAATFRELNAMEAQRDRAESELDAERKMRVEAEAASDRMVAERDALNNELCAHLAARNGLVADGLIQTGETTACAVRRLTTERDALKAKLDYETEASLAHMSNSLEWRIQRDESRAKLAALANAAEVVAENYEECAGFGELDCLAPLYAAIAAARGGA